MNAVQTDLGEIAPPRPVATRLRMPGWRDGRLMIGVLLVIASVVVGAAVVSAADRTVPVFAARRALATGSVVGADDLDVVRMRLSGTGARYLTASAPVPVGEVLVRPVGAGEVVPLAALAPAASVHLRPVSIPVAGPLPAGLAVGGLVDLWAAPKALQGVGPDYLDARPMASGAEVYHVDADPGGLSAGAETSVQVLLSTADLPAVLTALANDAHVSLLPVPGSGGARGTR